MTTDTVMKISHIKHSTVKTPSDNISLNKAIYILNTSRNLIFIHCPSKGSFVYLEFHLVIILSRIRLRGKFFLKDSVIKESILFHPHHPPN
jgi:gluconate kinase